jgi:hypothetical protein
MLGTVIEAQGEKELELLFFYNNEIYGGRK